MDNTKISKALSFFEKHAFTILLILWLVFGCLALIGVFFSLSRFNDANHTCPKSVLDYLNVSYAAAGALFTGFAFAITYLSLKHQKNELQKQNERLGKQISLDVFTDAFGHVLDSDNFREVKKYIYSNQFKEDVDTLVSMFSNSIREILLGYRKSFDQKIQELQNKYKDESIRQKIDVAEKEYADKLIAIRKTDEYKDVKNKLSIEDFRKIKSPIRHKKGKNDKNGETVKYTSASYERIKYFCDRMEYLGIIHFTYNDSFVHETSTQNDRFLIINYFGSDIISTYEILKTFIQTSQKEENKGNKYYNFTRLYNLAKERQNDYIETMKKLI